MHGVTHWVTPPTGVKVLESPGLGTPESLTVVVGVGQSRESHGRLWGWALHHGIFLKLGTKRVLR